VETSRWSMRRGHRRCWGCSICGSGSARWMGDVPSVDAVGSHVRTLGWSDTKDDAGTWWDKGALVEIKGAVQASVGREVGLAMG
jgi:hypothetical protein